MNTLPSACPCASTSGGRQLRDLGHPEERDVQGPQQLLWVDCARHRDVCYLRCGSRASMAANQTLSRGLEAAGRARATVTQRQRTIAGFYKYAVEEESLGQSPAVRVRRVVRGWTFPRDRAGRNDVAALAVARR